MTYSLPPNWLKTFYIDAKNVALRSKLPIKVGTVIIDPIHKVKVSEGFNGYPRGFNDTSERLRAVEHYYDLILHSEVNALLYASQLDLTDHVLITTRHPCAQCAAMIAQKGIKTIYSPKPDLSKDRYKQRYALTKALMFETGMEWIDIEGIEFD